MLCEHCRTPVAEDMLFCPECGQPVLPPEPAPASAPQAVDSGWPDDDFRILSARLESMDTDPLSDDDTPFLDETPPPSLFARPEPFSARPMTAGTSCSERNPETWPKEPGEPLPVRPGVSVPGMRQGEPAATSGRMYDAPLPELLQTTAPPTREDPEDFGDGYEDQPTVQAGRYRKTTAGKRIGSILLCILTVCMMLFAVLNVSLRLTLTEDHIHEAADGEKMLHQRFITGDASAVSFMRELIGSDEMAQYGITDEMLETALRGGTIPRLFENLLNGYADYFLKERVSEYLNTAYITGELERFNAALGEASGTAFDAVRVDKIADRINDGDLSFLSIDSEGGSFYRHYGVNPKAFATAGSLPILLICGAIAALCILMIFVVNSANAPASLRFNGVALVIVGGLSLVIAAGLFILSFVKDIWLLTQLSRVAALWTGTIGAGLLLIGTLFLVIARVLSRRAARFDAAATVAAA